MLAQTIKSIRIFLSSGLGILIFTCLFAVTVVRVGFAEEAVHAEKAQMEKAEGLAPLIKALENPEMREDCPPDLLFQGLSLRGPIYCVFRTILSSALKGCFECNHFGGFGDLGGVLFREGMSHPFDRNSQEINPW